MNRWLVALILSFSISANATAQDVQTATGVAALELELVKLANEAIKNVPVFAVYSGGIVDTDGELSRPEFLRYCQIAKERIERRIDFQRASLTSDGDTSIHGHWRVTKGTLLAIETQLKNELKRVGFEIETGEYLDLFEDLGQLPDTEMLANPIRGRCERGDDLRLDSPLPRFRAFFSYRAELRPVLRLSSFGMGYLASRQSNFLAWKNFTMHSSIQELAKSIQYSLGNLEMLPKHRRILQGFQAATDRLVAALAAGDRRFPPMHRSFANGVALLLSYSRALDEPFEDLAKLASQKSGLHARNGEMIEAIRHVLRCLQDAYGLDTDVQVHFLADNARVMADLISSQVNPIATPAEVEGFVKPVLADLSRLIATSETQGDVAAVADLERLLTTWNSAGVQRFVNDRLSAADPGYTSMATQLMMLVERMRKHAGAK